MKTPFRYLLALAGGLLAQAAQAQAPAPANGNFETWTARFNGDSPTGWLTTDDIAAEFLGSPLPFPTNTIQKSTVRHGGAFAAQLQTQLIPGFGEAPGVLLVGTRVATGPDFPGGIPFTGRPARLEFYYTLSGAQALADSATVQVLLTATVNGVNTEVGKANYLFRNTAAAYTLVALPITYSLGIRPDSVRLAFSTGDANLIHVGTTLSIDYVVFAGTATATRDAALNAAISIAPNPSPDGRFLLSAEAALLAAPLTVLDATGRVVLHEAAPATVAPARTLDLSGLPGGIYTVQLLTPRGLVTRKLVR